MDNSIFPEVLATKKSSEFRNIRPLVKLVGDSTIVRPYGAGQNFREMSKLRKPQDPKLIQSELKGDGHVFANIGVSAVLTLTYENNQYLVLVRDKRLDFKDVCDKLISGYRNSYFDQGSFYRPEESMFEEIAEEFLPCMANGKVLRGMRNFKLLETQFKDTVDFENQMAYQLIDSNLFDFPDIPRQRIIFGDDEIREGNPKIYFHAPSDSAQIIFQYHVDVPSVPQLKGFSHAEAEVSILKQNLATLNHAEDVPTEDFKELEVRLKDRGLLLVKLDEDGRLSRDVYVYGNGALEEIGRPVVLSEPFIPGKTPEGIVVDKNSVSLEEHIQHYSPRYK